MMCACTLFIAGTAAAQELKMPRIFADGMVLQRETEVPLWGWAEPGSKVTVTNSWSRKSCQVQTGPDGRWECNIATPEAGGPFTMKVSTRGRSIEFSEVYSGEVWLASGQSNMSMLLEGYWNQPVEGSTEAVLGSGNYNIHFVNIPAAASDTVCTDFEGESWVRATPATAGKCCAAAWFFAEDLSRQLGNIPIGIINTSFSGSSIEAWLSPEAEADVHRIYADNIDKFIEDSNLSNKASIHYNAMLRPVEGYGIRGFLWYQGECNVFNVPYYSTLFAAMVRDWRAKWGRGDLPFYAVQIAPYDYTVWDFFTPRWPEISAYLREQQVEGINSIEGEKGIAILLDKGQPDVIHPRFKKEAGHRLALLALAGTYGLTGFEYRSPEYDRMEVKDGKAIIHFKNMYMGISTFGRKLTLFEMAGPDRVFHPAEAYVDEGNATVVVSCPEVSEPAAVRYAFKNVVEGELFGTGGLPVSSFRTDNWD